MNLSQHEAEEALAAIQQVTQKTRRSIAGSGAHIFLIITGIIWLVGFLATQFLPAEFVAPVWIGISVLGSAASILMGARKERRVRSATFNATARRAGIFWLLLVLFCAATIAVAQPSDGKQLTMIVILFIMIGQLAMGLLLSFTATWWAAPLAALALAGYFLMPAYFYLWMAVLVGGGMIALGLYIRARW